MKLTFPTRTRQFKAFDSKMKGQETKMTVTEEIKARLQEAFAPSHLKIEDQSESHRGHAGFREGGESHFHVEITSDKFKGLSRIARHRAVHNALGKDLVGRIHALSLTLQA